MQPVRLLKAGQLPWGHAEVMQARATAQPLTILGVEEGVASGLPLAQGAGSRPLRAAKGVRWSAWQLESHHLASAGLFLPNTPHIA